jgi:hypothetical protein
MTPDEVKTSLESHQQCLEQILNQQHQLLTFVQKVHESWRDIDTEFQLVKLRISTLEKENGT